MTRPVSIDWTRVDPAPLSGGIGIAPADVSEFVESCGGGLKESVDEAGGARDPFQKSRTAGVAPGPQDLQPFPGYGEPTPLQRTRQNVRFSTDPTFAARAIDRAQLEEIARLGT